MKRLTSLFFVPIFALGVAACGDNGAEDDVSGEEAASNDSNGEASESDFPSGSIEVIVPYGAGGGTDLIARPLVNAAEERLDTSMSVVNITGGGGGVGMAEGANADPDGHTVTFITVESTILPHLGLAPFSYEDFEPVAQVAFDPATLSVPADAPYDTIEEFMAYVDENPGEVRVANVGTGGIWHLAASALEYESGVEFVHVPLDSGAGAVTEALGGHVEAVMLSTGEKFAQVESGDLKPLAVMSDERLDAIPDVPTFQESGFDVDTIGSWKGLAVPEETPDDVVAALSDAFIDAAEDEFFINFMEENALERAVLDPEEFADIMVESDQTFGQLIDEIELELD